MRISNYYYAIKELGIQPVLLNAIYRMGLFCGYYQLSTRSYSPLIWLDKTNLTTLSDYSIERLLSATDPDIGERQRIIDVADQICQGIILGYGTIPIELNFKEKPSEFHWSAYESGRVPLKSSDIKDIWEPARFSWVFQLGQAYYLTRDEKYPTFFWDTFEAFLESNPPNIGPHWMSGQEIALRLIACIFASQVFRNAVSTTINRKNLLKITLATHAHRIMATRIYALSQRNNHLLSEAAGLYTAGLLLKGLPDFDIWKQTGWEMFIQGLRDQIAPDGSYIQQSTSYHRLMLHLAIWIQSLEQIAGAYTIPVDLKHKLVLATKWLESLILSRDGQTPNMGANDGANILPLGGINSLDYRQTIKMANAVFKIKRNCRPVGSSAKPFQVIIMREGKQTACLRAACYQGRPSHADQLHLDLWWQDKNIAMDAGTYRYNFSHPWDNALSGTDVHNTIQIDNEDQMDRAGRFLWVRRANIHNLVLKKDTAGNIQSASAEHDGYHHLRITHKRTVISKPAGEPGWLVKDQLLPLEKSQALLSHQFSLCWLLPDWEWEVNQDVFLLHSPWGTIYITFIVNDGGDHPSKISIFRAGAALTFSDIMHQTWGWYSPTYGVKEPALSVRFITHGFLPMQLTTCWRLPK